MEVNLVVLTGKAEGKEIPLPSSQFVIGRASSCHLRPHSGLVSKLHCVVGRRAGKVVVRDLKSANKTFINGKAVTGTVYVEDGDLLAVGPLQFRFSISGGPAALGQKIRKEQVGWLMEESADSFVMGSDYETKIIELPPQFMDESDAEEITAQSGTDEALPAAVANSEDDPGDRNLSAGRYLREYFDQAESPQDESSQA